MSQLNSQVPACQVCSTISMTYPSEFDIEAAAPRPTVEPMLHRVSRKELAVKAILGIVLLIVVFLLLSFTFNHKALDQVSAKMYSLLSLRL